MYCLSSILQKSALIAIVAVAFLLTGCPPSTPPAAAFGAWPYSGYDPLEVAFTDQSLTGSDDIETWSWSFGDGGTSTLQNPSHTYTVPGVYPVSLTVTSDSGTSTVTQTNLITVRDADVDALIIYRYADAQEEAEQLADALAGRGLTSRIFFRSTYHSLTELDLSPPGMIILCSDAYSFDTAELTHLQDSGKGILATGGAYIALGNMGLHIAESAGASGRGIKIAEATHAVFNTPNDLDVSNGEQVDLFMLGTDPSAHGMYLGYIPPTADVTVLAHVLANTSYASLVMEDDRYMVWAFFGEFDRLSVPGLDLLENCVRYLMD